MASVGKNESSTAMRPKVKPALRMNSAAASRRIHARPRTRDDVGSPDTKNFQPPGFVAAADVERAFGSTSKIADDWKVTTGTNRVRVCEEKVTVTAKQVLHVVFGDGE